MIFLILSITSLLVGGLYFYFTQIVSNSIVWWSIPIIIVVAYLIAVFLLFLFFGICTLLHGRKREIKKPKPFFNWFIYHAAHFLRKFFRLKVVFEGADLIPANNKFLIVSNHQSNLDPLLIISAFKGKPVTYIMKDNLMRVPIVGAWAYASGFLPIDRRNDRQAIGVIAAAANRVKSGFPMAVYPEGTRSKGAKMNRFRNGIFRVALRAETPIVVMAVDNFYKVKDRFPWQRTNVFMKICKVIPYEEIKDMSTNEIGSLMQQIIANNLEEARIKYDWLQ